MAIAIRSSRLTGPTWSSALAVGMPNSPAPEVGDLLIAVGTRTSSGWSGVPSGWDLVSSNTWYYVMKRVATGSDTLTLATTSSTYIQGIVFAVQDANPDEVVTAYGTVAYDAGLSTVPSPAVTGFADGLVIRSASVELAQDTITEPSGVDFVLSASTATWALTQRYGRDTALASSTAIGAVTWTGMVTNKTKAGLTISIGPGAATAPTISSVTLTGTSQIGQTLTATVVTDPASGPTIAYQWEKDADGSGAGTDIDGATSSTLALSYADFGDLLDSAAYVRCGAIATDINGSSAEIFSDYQLVTVPSGSGSTPGSLIDSPLII